MIDQLAAFVPVEYRSDEAFDAARAEALVVNYYLKITDILSDVNLTHEQKNQEIENIALRLGYAQLTEYNRMKSRGSGRTN